MSIVIIGAGQAGGWAASTLRSQGFQDPIVLIGEEQHQPYERPPLSKAILSGQAGPQSTALFEPEDFDALALDFFPGETAVRVEPAQRLVHCASGQALPYDKLLLATGGRPRPISIPGLAASEILLLRTLEDALAIKARFENGGSIALIGGGWIGLELAAAAREAGLKTHLFELADRLCARAAPPVLSDYLLDLHQAHGVNLHLSTGIKAAQKGADGRYTIDYGDPQTLIADAIIAGIGLIPNDQLARDAGLAVDNGILTAANGQTSDPNIFACGDVANSLRTEHNQHIRYESWANAQGQGINVAKAMLGMSTEPELAPWFWSDQYDANIQIIGMPEPEMDAITRKYPENGKFSVFYLIGGVVKAAVTANTSRDMAVIKRLIANDIRVSADHMADETIKLKTILAGKV